MALGGDVDSTTETLDNIWKMSSSDVTYITGRTGEAYSLSSDNTKVSYVGEGSGTVAFTITGLQGITTGENGTTTLTALTLTSDVVTINSTSVLNSGTVSIDSGYKLALGSDITKFGSTGDNTWTETATAGSFEYKSGKLSAGYNLAENDTKINWVPESDGALIFTLTGLASDVTTSQLTFGTNSELTITKNMIAWGSNVELDDSKGISTEYRLALGSDIKGSETSAAKWISSATAGEILYQESGTTEGYALVGEGEEADTIQYISATGMATPVTISGLASTDTATIFSNTVTDTFVFQSAALDQDGVTIKTAADSTYKFALADDTTIKTYGEHWTKTDTAGTYYFNASGAHAGYKLEAGSAANESVVSYSAATTDAHLITLTGLGTLTINTDESNSETFGTATGININTASKVVEILSDDVLASSNVSIATTEGTYNGYMLTLGSDVSKYEATAAVWATETGKVNYTGEFYASDGYRLKTSDTSATAAAEIEYGTETTADTFTISGLTANTETLAGITWTSAMSGTVITISSDMVKDVKGNITIDNASGNSNTYKLTIADDAKGLDTVKAHFATYTDTALNTVLTFKGVSTLAGFTDAADGLSITYSGVSETGVLVGISGLKVSEIDDTDKDNDGVQDTLTGFTITTTSDNTVIQIDDTSLLGTSDVAIFTGSASETYTLALGEQVKAAVSKDSHWENDSSGNIFYMSSSTSSGYATVDDGKKIQYTAQADKFGMATITGLTNVSDATGWANPLNNTITLNRELLEGATSVSIASADQNNTYKFELAKDAKFTTSNKKFSLNDDGNEVTYTAEGINKGWKLASDTQIVNVAEAGKQTFTLSGLKDGLKIKKGLVSGVTVEYEGETDDTVLDENTDYSARKATITIDEKVLNKDSKATLTADSIFSLELGSGATETMKSGNYWRAENGSATYYTEAGVYAGYVIKEDSSTKVIEYQEQIDVTDSARITIEGLKESVTDKDGVVSGLEPGNNNLVNIYTKYIGENGATVTSSEEKKTTFQLAGKQTLVAGEDSKFVSLLGSGSNDVLINGSSISGTFYGGKGNDTIKAGKAGDSISGGVGNDYIVLGEGKDTYVYEGGKDVIENFDNDNDSITLNDSITSASASGNDLVLKVGSGSVTFKDRVNSDVTIGDTVFSGGVMYNKDKTVATVGAGFSGTFENTVETAATINAGNFNSALTYVNKTSTAQTIIGGLKADNITGGDGADSLIGGAGNDTLNGGKGKNTLSGGAGNDVFVHDGGEDYIENYNADGKDVISIAGSATISDYAVSGNDIVLSVDDGSSITVGGAKDAKININGENVIYGDHIQLNAAKTEITAGSKFTSEKFDSTALGYTAAITINAENAGSEKLEIVGNAKANVITGLKSSSNTLNGGKGNDVLTGGSAADVFVFNASEGNDLITNYGTGDSITMNAEITNAEVVDGNTVLYINKNSLTVQGVTSEITVNGKSRTYGNGFYTEGSTKTLFTASSGDITVGNESTLDGSAAKYALNIDASSSSSAKDITGGKKADTITGGSGNDNLNGGAGNDYIVGGKGDDTLFGGVGKDIFVYTEGDGNDVIADFANGDKIKVDKGEFTVTSDEKDVKLTFENGSITIQNAVTNGTKVVITDAEDITSSRVYTANYGVEQAAGNARTLDLFDDSNFLSDEPDISDVSAISDTTYSVGDIQENADTLSNPTLLAYSEDK